MRAVRVMVVLFLASMALVAIGCGSGHSKGSTSTTSATPQTSGGAQLAGRLTITDRVLHNGELAGMNPQGSPTVERNVTVWVAGENLSPRATNAELARVQRLGFKAGIREDLVTPGNMNRFGLSLLEEFSSHRAAEAELLHATGQAAAGPVWNYFAVPGIPGAKGFEATGSGQGGRNVGFADGDFYYLVGGGWQAAISNQVTRSQVIAAAQLLYRRVHRTAG